MPASHRLRLAVVAAALLIGMTVSPGSIADQAKVLLDLPAQDLSSALTQFGRQMGTEIVFSPDAVRSKRAPAVKGEFERDQALKILLDGTGLTYRHTANGAIVIEADAARHSATTEAEGASSDSRRSSAGDALTEIIVTATKREERLQDVPMSIAVIGNQDIERRGLIGMEDYLRSVPGVNQIDNGPLSNAIVIRGITTSPEYENFSSGTTVASYFGETPITAAAGMAQGGIDVRPVDIERIEILRGPQGTAYGSASLGGTLRMIPAAPKLDGFSAKVSGAFGSTSALGSENTMIQGVVNIPVVSDTFALRAVGYRFSESGFYRNVAGSDPQTLALAESYGLGDFVRGYAQDDVGRIRSTGGRLAGLWRASDRLNVSFNVLTQRIEADGWPLAEVGRYEQAHLPVAVGWRERGETGDVADTSIDLANLVLTYDLGWAELTAAASKVDGGSVLTDDLTSLVLLPETAHSRSDFDSFTGEVRLASKLEGPLQYLAGLFYEDVDDGFLYNYIYPGTQQTNPFGSNPLGRYDYSRNLEQRAVFGEISYALTPQLTATLGGRYFKYEKKERDLAEGSFFDVDVGSGVPVLLESDESHSIFKANLSYRPTLDSQLYASWSQGFRLGRPQTGLPAALCDRNPVDGLVDGSNVTLESTRSVDSDFLDNYELGSKVALFDRRVLIDAAVYHIEWDGLPAFVRPDCGINYTANAGSATSDGLEVQTSIAVTTGLRLDLGAGYTKAELSSDAPAQGWRDGDRLPGAPKVSANLGAQYEFEALGYKAFVRTDSFYTGSFYGDFAESPNTKAGGYVKVDARAGVAIRNIDVELFVRNLTNEDSFTWRGLSNALPLGGYRLRPRTVGIQLGYRFE